MRGELDKPDEAGLWLLSERMLVQRQESQLFNSYFVSPKYFSNVNFERSPIISFVKLTVFCELFIDYE